MSVYTAKSLYDQWKDRDPRCTCEPPHSSRPSICDVHCRCMEAGRSTYIPMIDGMCRRCRKFPLYDYANCTDFLY